MTRSFVDTAPTTRRPAGTSPPTDIDRHITLLAAELLAALAGWRRAKQVFADRTDAYRRRYHDATTAEFQAQGDHQRSRSVADASWYQQEIQTASLALIALADYRRWTDTRPGGDA